MHSILIFRVTLPLSFLQRIRTTQAPPWWFPWHWYLCWYVVIPRVKTEIPTSFATFGLDSLVFLNEKERKKYFIRLLTRQIESFHLSTWPVSDMTCSLSLKFVAIGPTVCPFISIRECVYVETVEKDVSTPTELTIRGNMLRLRTAKILLVVAEFVLSFESMLYPHCCSRTLRKQFFRSMNSEYRSLGTLYAEGLSCERYHRIGEMFVDTSNANGSLQCGRSDR